MVAREKSVDEGLLSELFAATTTSYKYLLFLAILKAVRRSDFRKSHWNLEDLVREIFVIAWHPYSRFALSLGSEDIDAGIDQDSQIPVCAAYSVSGS
jgi:hypothetical protein